MSASNKQSTRPGRKRPSATAAGFLAAFGLSVATIIYTGLKVGAPRERPSAAVETRQLEERDNSRGAEREAPAPSSVGAPAPEAGLPEDPDAAETPQ